MKRKLMLSLAVVLFALISLTTATYAWFTAISQTAQVDQFELNVINDNQNLWISTTGEEDDYHVSVTWDGILLQIAESYAKKSGKVGTYFKGLLKDYNNASEAKKQEKLDVLKAAIADTLFLNNVTTTDLEDFENSYSGTIAEENVDYLTFTLWFKSDNPDATGIYLMNDKTGTYTYDTINPLAAGTYVYSKGIDFISKVAFNYDETTVVAKNEKGTYYAADALRIGVTELNCDSSNLNAADERTDLKKFIWDVTGADKDDRSYGYEFGALDYLNKAKGAVDETYVPLTAPTGTDLDDVQALTVYDLTTLKNIYAKNNNTLCCTLQAGKDGEKTVYYGKVQVFVWLEGWDGDCFDGILEDMIKLQLQFSVGTPYPNQEYPEE